MLQPGGDADLLEEPVRSEGGGEVGAEDLQGDLAVVAEVVGEVHCGHPAAAELALDAVALGQAPARPDWGWVMGRIPI